MYSKKYYIYKPTVLFFSSVKLFHLHCKSNKNKREWNINTVKIYPNNKYSHGSLDVNSWTSKILFITFSFTGLKLLLLLFFIQCLIYHYWLLSAWDGSWIPNHCPLFSCTAFDHKGKKKHFLSSVHIFYPQFLLFNGGSLDTFKNPILDVSTQEKSGKPWGNYKQGLCNINGTPRI